MIPAAYDVHERVRAMDEDGVWAELLFPTFPRFGGNRFLEADDKDLALACVQAWNDWMLDEWCAAYPDRFIPQTLIPLWDIAARGRARSSGARRRARRASSSSRTRTRSGCRRSRPATGTRCSRRAADTGLPLSMHIGTSSGLLPPSPDATPSVGIALCGINSMSALGDLIFSRRARRPSRTARSRCRKAARAGCRTCSSASTTRGSAAATKASNCTAPPSEVFAQHFWVCMVADRYAIVNRDLIGLDKLMWECDFPHNDSNWPDSRKVLADAVHDIPDDEARQIGELNARELYRFPRA